jgi:bacteriocin biosynthesis cyclodehydratase domain-containing protein
MTPVAALTAGPRLDPAVPILVRPSGTLQLGWDPERALLLRPPAGVTAVVLATLLRRLDGRHSRAEVLWQANLLGIDTADITQILAELDQAAVLVPDARAAVVRSVHLHGRGPLSDAIATALAGGRVRLSRSVPGGLGHRPRLPAADCVVLADELVPDPRLVADLDAARTAHLPVRLRDGRGVVGPLVLPGRTSCLRCADLTRADLDDEWPHLAAQLLGAVGHAGPETVLATTGLALAELRALIRGDPARAPASLNATLELDLGAPRLLRRRWRPHPHCGCRRPIGRSQDRQQ